jgi:hypothetical protein
METTPPPIAEPPKPRLRWYQYSLRSLFVLTTLVAIGCSWLTVTIQNQRRQKAAGVALQKAGGTVLYKQTWLGRLLRDTSLLRAKDATFSGQPTSDVDLVHLQELSQLQRLCLGKTRITNVGLVYLETLSQLQELDLEDTKVTDVGLAHLQGLSQLKVLLLNNTDITDAGLLHLRGLQQLQKLSLRGTKVTDQGVKRLKHALPKCGILR